MEYICQIQKLFKEKYDSHIKPIIQTRSYEPVSKGNSINSNYFQRYKFMVSSTPICNEDEHPLWISINLNLAEIISQELFIHHQDPQIMLVLAVYWLLKV